MRGFQHGLGDQHLYAVEKMGGRGVAIGSDVNGAAALPGRASARMLLTARTAIVTACRCAAAIDAQKNGVRYAMPIRDYRWHRFDEGGSNAYDREEREAWQAIAQYVAGFHPDRDQHPEDDVPPIALTTLDNRLHYCSARTTSITLRAASGWPMKPRRTRRRFR